MMFLFSILCGDTIAIGLLGPVFPEIRTVKQCSLLTLQKRYIQIENVSGASRRKTEDRLSGLLLLSFDVRATRETI